MVTVGGIARRVQRAFQTLERECETRRRDIGLGRKHAREDRIVPAARAHGVGKAARVRLEHQAGVVVEGIHDGKIEGQQRGILSIQPGDERTKLTGHIACNAGGGKKLIHAIQNRSVARQTGQLADGCLHGLGFATRHHARIQVNKIIGVNHAQGVGGKRRVAHLCEQRLEGANASAHDLGISKPQGANGARHQRDHLDVARGVTFADKLEAQLRKLARTAGAAHLLTHDRGLIAQTERQIGRAHARGDQTHDGKRVVGAHHKQAAVVIKELERGIGNAAALLEGAFVLEQRGFDRKVMMGTEAIPHRLRDLLARLSLLGQDVSESPRCGRHTCAHPLCGS